jgi:hypothetical protein
VRPLFRKLFIGALLTLCLGLQLLEATGRWDRTLGDTADEAQIVTILLCVGGAIAGAASMLARLQAARPWLSVPLAAIVPTILGAPARTLRPPLQRPPVSLRI